MRQKEKTILNTMVNAYLLLVLAALPLYMQDKLTMIGDAKYFFFRNVSIAFGAAALICILLKRLLYRERRRICWSLTDCFILAYGAFSVLAFLLSENRENAFWGYPGWYMGLFSQLIFVGSYFFVSRWFENERFVWAFAGLSAGAVMAVGVLNRLDIDPLGTLASVGDEWNKIHLLSTIGNNNWYAGYISVAAGIGLAAMVAGEGIWRVLGTVSAFLYFATALTQGSMTGVAAMGAILICLVLLCLSDREKLLRAMEAVLLLPLSNLFLRVPVKMGLTGMVMENDSEGAFFFHGFWYGLLAVSLIFYGFIQYRKRTKSEDLLRDGKIQRAAVRILLPVLAAGCLSGLIFCFAHEGQFDFDSGRLSLWKAAFQCFGRESIRQKLFGVGPDCFYHAFYEMTNLGGQFTLEGIWADAVYVNAHNEWINMLICEGVFGLAAYAGIFLAIVYRIGKHASREPAGMAVLLGTIGYAVCACFTFQQVISTPLLFALWGMAEAVMRRSSPQSLHYDEKNKAREGRRKEAP